ncbi:MAG: bifunctional 4-hydroxy-2-oxoglutarate aldolase/2-dehydro-3-deoxy-phosphogluconate aldolase [Planctomycetaceae bacterium]|nr:bifunctional 4-hydroxy-2-oxoglutarate aldolase/2-dehydro-3-deoxy-phosphogluconate aldolase [Planctomycetaceae bacterium]
MESQFPSSMLSSIQSSGVVAVLILERADDAVPVARALLKGGVKCMELTLRTDAAIEALRQIRQQVPEMLAGIGTVLRAEQVDEIVAAGAQFAVSPGLNPGVVDRAQELGLPFAPGVMTPSEIEVAIELGCRELKFFPAEPSGGLKMLDSLRAPYSHLGVQFIPLGGISATNLKAWLSNPGVFAVGGSWLAPKDLIQAKNWDAITDRAEEASRLVAEVRSLT